jgi:hypothetical protein
MFIWTINDTLTAASCVLVAIVYLAMCAAGAWRGWKARKARGGR